MLQTPFAASLTGTLGGATAVRGVGMLFLKYMKMEVAEIEERFRKSVVDVQNRVKGDIQNSETCLRQDIERSKKRVTDAINKLQK